MQSPRENVRNGGHPFVIWTGKLERRAIWGGKAQSPRPLNTVSQGELHCSMAHREFARTIRLKALAVALGVRAVVWVSTGANPNFGAKPPYHSKLSNSGQWTGYSSAAHARLAGNRSWMVLVSTIPGQSAILARSKVRKRNGSGPTFCRKARIKHQNLNSTEPPIVRKLCRVTQFT